MFVRPCSWTCRFTSLYSSRAGLEKVSYCRHSNGQKRLLPECLIRRVLGSVGRTLDRGKPLSTAPNRRKLTVRVTTIAQTPELIRLSPPVRLATYLPQGKEKIRAEPPFCAPQNKASQLEGALVGGTKSTWSQLAGQQ